jgi:hypothetical protein
MQDDLTWQVGPMPRGRYNNIAGITARATWPAQPPILAIA